MKMKKSVKVFIAACVAGEVSERAIRGARRTLNGLCRRTAPADPLEHANAIINAVELHKPRVTSAQMEKGRAWLLDGSLKKDGTMRKTPLVQSVQALAIIKGAHCARLIGFNDVGTSGYSNFKMIYRYETDTQFFDYAAGSWQSGGFEVFGWENKKAAA